MPPRRRKRVRCEASSDEEAGDDAVAAILQARPVASSRKPAGISADALQKEPPTATRPESGLAVGISKPKQGADIIERRMEQYLDAGLQAAFTPAEAREDEPANVHEEGSTDDVPVYQTKAIAEVSVPGFNTAITEYRLDSEASKQGQQATQRLLPAGSNKSGRGPPPSGLDASKDVLTGFVPRQQFPRSFGKQRAAASKR